jgi:hypothetical protein
MSTITTITITSTTTTTTITTNNTTIITTIASTTNSTTTTTNTNNTRQTPNFVCTYFFYFLFTPVKKNIVVASRSGKVVCLVIPDITVLNVVSCIVIDYNKIYKILAPYFLSYLVPTLIVLYTSTTCRTWSEYALSNLKNKGLVSFICCCSQ